MVYVAVQSTHPSVRYVRVAMPATDADAELASLRRLAVVAFAVGVPVALLVAWLTTAPLGRRLQAVTRLAAAYKAGDLPAAPRDFPPDELGTVARALDDAARELSHRVADLSQDRARIDAIVAGMVEGVLVVDRDGRIQRVNAAARHLLGVSEVVLGQPFMSVLRDRAVVDLLSSAESGRRTPPSRCRFSATRPGRSWPEPRPCLPTAAGARCSSSTTSATRGGRTACARISLRTSPTSFGRR